MKLDRIEQWRMLALKHVDEDAAARLLEDTKTAVFSQMVKARGDISIARAETEVRASGSWREFVKNVVDARTKANRAKIEAEVAKMRMWETVQDRADERQLLRMTEGSA